MSIVAEGLHGALHAAGEKLLADGHPAEGVTSPTSVGSRFGTRSRASTELLGLSITITNPLDRLIPGGCVPFHVGYAAANFLWSIRRDAQAHEILAYNAAGSPLLSAAGEFQCGLPRRLVGADGRPDALAAAIALLRVDPHTRRALVPFIIVDDLLDDPRDFPCMASFQLLIRQGRLHAITHMRSQALLSIFPYDVFLFTMLQEAAARLLDIDLGPYLHICNSAHAYDDERARFHLLARCTATAPAMPPMPGPGPLAQPDLVSAEAALRADVGGDAMSADPYWGPLFDSMRETLVFNRERWAR